MHPKQIEVGDETVEVVEVTPLDQFFGSNINSAHDAWRNQGVVNVLRVRRKGEVVLVFEYGPGYYEFQRRYTLKGDERAGREPRAGDNPL